MLDYMTTSPAWMGLHPPRFLIWGAEILRRPKTYPRPIPPDTLDQFDALLDQTMQAIKSGQAPPLLSPMYWDDLLILRHTGMLSEDLLHLKALDERGHGGCLEQDSEGYWWIRIDWQNTKMKKDHRVPTRMSDGVVEAIRRQSERVKQLPHHFGENYLFRTEQGLLP
jgi:hypothetical protein